MSPENPRLQPRQLPLGEADETVDGGSDAGAGNAVAGNPAPGSGAAPGSSAGGKTVIAQLRDFLGFEPGVQLRSLTTESAFAITAKKEEGKYVIEREIGQGGMGRVFLAFDRDLRRQVAIKVVQSQHQKNPELLARFVDEAQITGQLEHPGIPPVHELAINQDKEIFFTMKLLRGRTLKEIIRELLIGRREVRQRFSRTKLLQYLLSVANALHFAHEKGVIHRDVKPDNIMIGDYGEVQLMDWGLAKVIGVPEDGDSYPEKVESIRSEKRLETLSSHIQGTLLYMAPEQAQGRPLDQRADIYALGATLYELLTYLPPRTGGSTNEFLEEARLGLVIPPSQRAPKQKIPEALEDICLKAMEYHPDDRFPSAAEMADAIQVYLDGTFEEERRRVESEHLLGEARRVLHEHESGKAALDGLRVEMRELDSASPKKPTKDQKRRLRGLRAELEKREIANAQSYTQAQTLLSAALAANPENAPARKLLGDLYLERLRQAEREHKTNEAVFYLGLIRQINDGSFDRIIQGNGSLQLVTEPMGAAMTLWRLEEEDGVLAPALEIARAERLLELPDLPMGSYIVLIDKEGFAPTRFPVSIRRNEDIRAVVRLYSQERIPDGFAYVPGGPFIKYGDPKVFSTFEDSAEVALPDFAIGIVPVTCGEYLEYLNALHARDHEEARARSPRESEKSGFLWNADGGGYRLPEPGRYRWHARLPVFGISFEDAAAYCRWRSRRDGLPYDLPAEEEWEKAAKGVDGRFFAWGSHFDNELANTYFSRDGEQGPVDVDAFPGDCSPYGVRGMVGNVSDWCYLESSDRKGQAALRGGNWALTGDPCRLSVRRATARSYVSDRFGFRVKLRLEG
jgi:serine/threonine-protein kinase